MSSRLIQDLEAPLLSHDLAAVGPCTGAFIGGRDAAPPHHEGSALDGMEKDQEASVDLPRKIST